MTGRDSAYYDDQAEQELLLAAHASSEEQRKIHLNQAAEFSTMAERAMDGGPEDVHGYADDSVKLDGNQS